MAAKRLVGHLDRVSHYYSVTHLNFASHHRQDHGGVETREPGGRNLRWARNCRSFGDL